MACGLALASCGGDAADREAAAATATTRPAPEADPTTAPVIDSAGKEPEARTITKAADGETAAPGSTPESKPTPDTTRLTTSQDDQEERTSKSGDSAPSTPTPGDTPAPTTADSAGSEADGQSEPATGSKAASEEFTSSMHVTYWVGDRSQRLSMNVHFVLSQERPIERTAWMTVSLTTPSGEVITSDESPTFWEQEPVFDLDWLVTEPGLYSVKAEIFTYTSDDQEMNRTVEDSIEVDKPIIQLGKETPKGFWSATRVDFEEMGTLFDASGVWQALEASFIHCCQQLPTRIAKPGLIRIVLNRGDSELVPIGAQRGRYAAQGIAEWDRIVLRTEYIGTFYYVRHNRENRNCARHDHVYPVTGYAVFDPLGDNAGGTFYFEVTGKVKDNPPLASKNVLVTNGDASLRFDVEPANVYDLRGQGVSLETGLDTQRFGISVARELTSDLSDPRLTDSSKCSFEWLSSGKFVRFGTPQEVRGPITGRLVGRGVPDPPNEGAVALYRRDDLTKPIRTAKVDKAGNFTLSSVPVFVPDAATGDAIYEADYVLRVTDVQAPGDLRVHGDTVVYFLPAEVSGIKAYEHHEIVLQGLAEVGIKKRFIERLSKISPGNYAPVEARATVALGELQNKLNQQGQSGVALEALRRGIWAERIVHEAAVTSDQMLTTMLAGVADLIANIYDDLDLTSGKVRRAKGWRDRIQKAEKSADPNATRKLFEDYSGVFGAPNAHKYNHPLGQAENLARTSEVGGILKKALKLTQAVTSNALQLAGMDVNVSNQTALFVNKSLFVMLSYIQTRSIKGAANPLVGDIAKVAVGLAKGPLFESAPLISYTGKTTPPLDLAVFQMSTWDRGDFDVYFEDAVATKAVLDELVNEWTTLRQELLVLQAITKSADRSEKALELGEDLTPNLGGARTPRVGRVRVPWFELIKLAVKATKYITNTLTITKPLGYVYWTAPEAVTKGVDSAFGIQQPVVDARQVPDAPEAVVASARRPRERLDSLTLRAVGDPLTDAWLARIETSATALKDAVDRIGAHLESNEVGAALDVLYSEEPEGYLGAKDQWKGTRNALGLLGFGSGSNRLVGDLGATLNELSLDDLEFLGLDGELMEGLDTILMNIVEETFDGLLDPYYVAERNATVETAGAMNGQIDRVAELLGSLVVALDLEDLAPAVLVDVSAPASSDTGGLTVTRSPEDFVVRAHVANVGQMPVDGISLRLNVDDLSDTTTVVGEAEMTVAGGTLHADDGTPGSGPDEAEVEWTVRYDGDLASESVVFEVEVLENGAAPTGFVTIGDQTVLSIDVSLTDTDYDLLPDEYELANGLSVGLDDAGGDSDGDGLSNITEYRFGTDPRSTDSDSDGLSDAEELVGGLDGHVTDPVSADTDEDGIADADDGAPLDTSTSEPSDVTDDPAVEVDRIEVTLTSGRPAQTVSVSNAGEGVLRWTAISANRALVVVDPAQPDVSEGITLTIRAGSGYDFGAGVAEAVVWVIDVGGATNDIRSIRVTLQP